MRLRKFMEWLVESFVGMMRLKPFMGLSSPKATVILMEIMRGSESY